jgi:hypothetical protein
VPPWAEAFYRHPSNHLLCDQSRCSFRCRQFFTERAVEGADSRCGIRIWPPACRTSQRCRSRRSIRSTYSWSPIGPFDGSGIAAFLKLFFAGAFTLLYLRRLGVSSIAALASGLVFALSGFMIVWLGHPHVNCAVLLPLLLYFIEGQFGAPRRIGPAIGLACAYGAMLLGGHPPTAFHITVSLRSTSSGASWSAAGNREDVSRSRGSRP